MGLQLVWGGDNSVGYSALIARHSIQCYRLNLVTSVGGPGSGNRVGRCCTPGSNSSSGRHLSDRRNYNEPMAM